MRRSSLKAEMRHTEVHMHLLLIATITNWCIANGWMWRTAIALRKLPAVPNLLAERYAAWLPATEQPLLCVIVPARNEGNAMEATLRSLLAVEHLNVEIIAVDDRSTDGTGAIMDRMAAEALACGKNLRVIHVEHLPEGWMGKTHAMALAARQTNAPWLLFTDGDVVFRNDSLSRAMQYVTQEQADHLVLFPTLILRAFGERMMISMFQTLALWAARPWRIPDPRAKRDYIGVGAFNLVRREVYTAIGGFETLRMEVLEDLRFGYQIKREGYRQRVAFGRDLIRIRWAEGALGIMRNLTKNFFAMFRFRPLLLLGACAGMAVVCIGPFAGLFGPFWMRLASLMMMAMLCQLYVYYQRFTGIGVYYVVLFPVATCLLLFTIVRSMVLTLVRGGVEWRGTRYPLKELRKHAGPLW